MSAEIKLGLGWSVGQPENKGGIVLLEKGQLANLFSPKGEQVTIFHGSGVWIGLKDQDLTQQDGKVVVKTGAGVGLYNGSSVQVGREGDQSYLKVEHIK